MAKIVAQIIAYLKANEKNPGDDKPPAPKPPVPGEDGKPGKDGAKGDTGPPGPKGDKGDPPSETAITELIRQVVSKMDLKGEDGKPGADAKAEDIKPLIERELASKAIRVVFEAGDESDEPERIVTVKLINGELRIPASQLRIRNVNAEGKQIGSPLLDTAPLGKPLKFRFVPPVEAK